MNTRRQTLTNQTDRNQFIDFREILKKYIYHWPIFLLGILIAVAAGLAYLRTANTVYELTSTILVKDEKKTSEQKVALPELQQSTSPKNAETEIEIIRSKDLISQVVDSLQLWTSYKTKKGLQTVDLYETAPVKFVLLNKTGILNSNKLNVLIKSKNSFQVTNLSGQPLTVDFGKEVRNSFGSWTLQSTPFTDQYIGSEITIDLNDPDLVSNNYLKALDAHLLDKSSPTIGLFITDEVAKRGEDFLNDLVKYYNRAAYIEEKRKTKSTIDFIDNRLASLTGELNRAESNVAGYRSSQGLTDISTQVKADLESSQANQSKLNDVNVQLGVIEELERYVNSPSTNESIPATMGISDPGLNSSIEKLSQLQLKKTSLLAITPPGNPVFEPINKQIEATKGSIKETIRGLKKSLISTKAGLETFKNNFQTSIKTLPGQERQVVDMKRQSSIKENLYVYLLQKREELALSYASTFVDARVVDKANISDIKWPRKSVVMAIALLCGLGFPIVIISSRNSIYNKITSRRDIANVTDVPIIGELSYESDQKNSIVVNKIHHLVGEQFRALRTNLHYLHLNKKPLSLLEPNVHKEIALTGTYGYAVSDNEHKGRVTLLTSSVSKEGKSFVSSNLAASLAASGKKTVLLEMDLRKPKVSGIFNLVKDHPGITEFLQYNDIPVQDIVQATNIDNLNVIGAGHIASEPAELLEKERLSELIANLRGRYDEIVIDTPPAHLVTDSLIIAREADISLYVIRQGHTGKEELNFIKEVYETEKLPNMNIVFNGITKNKYGYGYNYDNSYYNEGQRKSMKVAWRNLLSRF